jgi:hypothetical protein
VLVALKLVGRENELASSQARLGQALGHEEAAFLHAPNVPFHLIQALPQHQRDTGWNGW